VQVVDSSTQIKTVAAAVESVSANALPGTVAQVLPADSSKVLDNALYISSTATPKTLTAINLAAYSTTDSNISSANSIPVISGSPATSVLVNNGYMFQPGVYDADGDSLTFSITNKPRWAVFNSATGRLYGTPADPDVGTYNNIVIAVSDGFAIAALPAFSIRVDAATGSGSFTLGWTAPVKRADGTPLSLGEIDGYRIYYGSSPGVYDHNVNIVDGSALSATVKNVPAGDYRVVMTTYDVKGSESAYSAEIIKQAK
ncbi:MAG TPA: putative Ig domain-containing protein, partial [Gammaproteobacteria bacterium]|nr:putative Ig domain-containing protein [Gammaproteobacteria bacterium]